MTVECFPRVFLPIGHHEIIEQLIADKEQIDIVHFHMIWFLDKNVIANALSRAKIPFIITTHGTYSTPHAMTGKRLIAKFLFERAYLNAATEIHAITYEEAEKLKQYGYNGDTFIAPNGIALEEVPLVRKNDVLGVSPGSNVARFIWIGVKREDKNLVALFQAVALLSKDIRDQFKIFLLGPNYNNNEAKYKMMVTKLGVVNNFCFMGPVYEQDKYDALESAMFTFYRHFLRFFISHA